MPEKYAILWDMDGVLVDSGQVHYHAWLKVLEPHDIPYSWDIFAETFGMTNNAIIKDLFPDPDPDFIKEMDDAKENQFRSNVPGNVIKLPGTEEWLERFKAWGYPQAICSSAPQANIDTILEEVQIGQYFQAVVTATRMASKPDPAVFLKAAEMLGIQPEHCIVFEDAPAGIEGARRGGMKCVALTTTHPAEDLQGADIIVENLAQLDEKTFLELIRD